MWVDGGKHRADLYLQAWAAWPTQPHELHNFHGVNGFQHWEVPTLAKLTGCILPFSSDSRSVTFKRSWTFSQIMVSSFTPPQETQRSQTDPTTNCGGFALRPVTGKWRSQWNRAEGKGFWQFSLVLGELHRWMHSFQSHHTAQERKSYHRTSQGFQPLSWALPQRWCLDRNRCDNKWPLELHPESCWPFPESCSSSWAPGFSLETLRSWHTTKKGQQHKKKRQSIRLRTKRKRRQNQSTHILRAFLCF